MKVNCSHTKLLPLSALVENPRNPNSHPSNQVELLAKILQYQGWRQPIVVSDRSGFIVKGHGRLQAAKLAGFSEAPVDFQSYESEAQEWADLIADNRIAELSEFDAGELKDLIAELDTGELDLELTGFTEGELASLVSEIHQGDMDEEVETLAARFGAPPFTVLDSKQGWWQERKRWWISHGIRSEVGRGENLLKYSETVLRGGKPPPPIGKISGDSFSGGDVFNTESFNGTSVFDPVVAELAYLWFCPSKGKVLDPFAGGSVRGIVAGKMGLTYQGVELREEQVAANEKQADEIPTSKRPSWVCGDSRELGKLTGKGKVDLVFSCPPYGNLEKYSKDERDLSNMTQADFLKAYREIITEALGKLKANRFAVFMVGDYRGKDGYPQNFVSETIDAFSAAGGRLYNSAIYLQMIGSLPLRVRKIFQGGRKLGKAHQNLLVFLQGRPKENKGRVR